MKRYKLILESDIAEEDKFTKLSIDTFNKNKNTTPEQAKANAKQLLKETGIDRESIFRVLLGKVSEIPSSIGRTLKDTLNKVISMIKSFAAWTMFKVLDCFIWLVAILFISYFSIKSKFSKPKPIEPLDESVNFYAVVTEPEVESAWKSVLKQYDTRYGVDLSYMNWNFSDSPRGKDSKVNNSIDSYAGAWTTKGVIFLNPKMLEFFNKYNTNVKSKRKLTMMLKYIIAHELAYELWYKRKKHEELVTRIVDEIGNSGAGIKLNLKHNGNKSKLFADYIAKMLVPDCITESVSLDEALFNSDYIRSFIKYAYDTSLEFIDNGLNMIEDQYNVPRKAVGVLCFLACMVGLYIVV